MIIKTGFISRVAFTIAGIDIYWYAVLIVSAIVIGIIWSLLKSGRYNIKFDTILDLCIFMIPISILCARAYYVIFNLNYYTNNPLEILDFRNGGLAIYGGIIGAVITIIVFCKIKKVNILNLTDYIAPIIPLGQAIGRWGNYINIEAYGIETNLPLKMEIIENGVTKYVHPTFLYESVGNFILFLILLKMSKNRNFSGQITLLYFIGYAFIRFFIEGLRTDSLMIGNIRASQLLSLIIFIICTVVYIVIAKNKRIKLKERENVK
ncbi:prolipoprotein diacylglyceryl transferase [Clostridium sp. CAG:492]|nr:prolipoprotein diacylglyceryl transferase [Clostridium sp. CAG:492]